MLDRRLIGKEYGPVVFAVEKQRLRFFAQATGQTDPVFLDEDAARAQGHPALLAPPTFLTTVPMEQPNPLQYLDDLGIDIGRLLHAEQNYRYLAPVHAGDTITYVMSISDMFDKKGGALQFCSMQSQFTNQHGTVVATLDATLVVR